MGRFAVIDVGSNSMKMHVADVDGDRVTAVDDRTEVTRLGEGLRAGGELTDGAVERNVRALGKFAAAARELGAAEIVAVGTMALRTASNRERFLRRVREEHGLEVEVISGDEEARLASLAAVSGLGAMHGAVCIFDAGGGSTEFIFLRGGELEQSFSLAVGGRRLTEDILRSDPVAPAEMAKLNRTVADLIAPAEQKVNTLIGIGGTVTSLGSILHRLEKYDPEIVQGTRLTAAEVDRQIALFAGLTVEERKEIVGLMPKRADVILAGAAIVRGVMRKVARDELLISDRGVRHGVMVDRFARRG
jgi:exopolyphosphatase/guanosine-5'-triphosphate,3'-diphosphate pyrophosphatase